MYPLLSDFIDSSQYLNLLLFYLPGDIIRFIPKIKSHVAEEMTLDRCVQRLRKRLVVESQESAQPSGQNVEATNEKMGNRVPSFFTSPSLINLGGLSLGDPYTIQNVSNESSTEEREFSARSNSPQIEIKPGWAGMGLRGNHSYASLTRPTSVGSGLFLEEESDEDGSRSGNQAAGEVTVNNSAQATRQSGNVAAKERVPYVKTTTMANFYYRKTKSHENLGGDQGGGPGDESSPADARRTKSDADM